MRPPLLLFQLAAILLIGLREGKCFYNPQPGQWFSRDPIGEEGGLNLYGLVANAPLETTDSLGLSSTSSPGTSHVSNDQHNNYLSYNAVCPRGWKVANIWIDYNDAAFYAAMRAWANQNVFGGVAQDYETQISNSLGGSLGGFRNPDVRRNCLGIPIEVQAFMRTRLVAPALHFGAWRQFNAAPDPATTVALYQEHTRVHWTCDACCGRGMGN